MGQSDLDALYAEAQAALAAGDRDGAGGLLKQIVLADENYKDASRLLAALVERRRRRWYSRPLPWAGLGLLMLVALATLWRWQLEEWVRPTLMATPAAVATAGEPIASSVAVLPSPTAIPLRWSRLYHGSLFARDAVAAIVLNPEDPDVMYAGLDHAAIYKTVDGGISWAPAHAGLGAAHILCLTIDPQNPHTLYACVSGAGVFKTTDSGSTWRAINAEMALNPMTWWAGNAVLDPLDSRHLLYAGVSYLYESRDGGDSWTTLWSQDGKEAPYAALEVAVNPADPRILFVVGDAGGDDTRGGVYVSTDGGRTWSLSGVGGRLVHLAIDATGQYLYASNDRVVGSSDGGRTWRELTKDTPCTSLAVRPDDGTTAVCGMPNGELLASTDAGSTWIPLGKPGWGEVGSVGLFPGVVNKLLAGARGIYLSTDGGLTWAERFNGLGAGLLDLRLGLEGGGNLYAVESNPPAQMVDTSAFRSSDGGRNWTPVTDLGQGLAQDADGQTLYRFRFSPGEVRRSLDGGATWTGLPAPGWIGGLAADPNQPGRLLLYTWDTPHVYRSTDQGVTWQPASGIEGLKGGWFHFSVTEANRVYIVGIENPHRSEDGGRSWTKCQPISHEIPQSTTSLAIDPRDAERHFLATRGGGIFLSQDGCRSWIPANEGIGNLFVNTVAIDPKNPDILYAGTDGGAYVSSDSGAHWGEINEGLLGATVVYSIAVDAESNVYAATPYGVFTLEPE